MSTVQALIGARIFDGHGWHDDKALVIDAGKVSAIVPLADVPASATRIDASGQIIAPGFIDCQVNGGGGVLLNDNPSADHIAQICSAHARFGTTALLPTLITDTRDVTRAAIAAGHAAKAAQVPGFIGLHLEGPHLSVARKGAHEPSYIRPMEDEDLGMIVDCGGAFPAMITTIAPENVSEAQVLALSNAGITVSLGHTDCTFETAKTYVTAGASMVTHLFNAMSQLGHRQPGLVGAALSFGELSVGLIADGFHVDPAAMSIALRAKQGPGKMFLVTDAMSTIGSDQRSFFLNGREIFREGGCLRLADGTFAGSDIDMLSSIRFVHEVLALDLGDAIQLATVNPAAAIGLQTKGALTAGMDADFVVLSPALDLVTTWIAGNTVFQA